MNDHHQYQLYCHSSLSVFLKKILMFWATDMDDLRNELNFNLIKKNLSWKELCEIAKTTKFGCEMP